MAAIPGIEIFVLQFVLTAKDYPFKKASESEANITISTYHVKWKFSTFCGLSVNTIYPYLPLMSYMYVPLVSLPPTLNDRPPRTLQRSGRSEIS